MASEMPDPVLVRVKEKLCRLSPTPFECCGIFIVPDQLRKINEKAYEPEIIAIGPYHHGKDHLKAMEDHKLRYLQKLLQRIGESKLSSYVTAISAKEELARRCYKGCISLESDEFVEMMLIDSCFIVELIRKNELICKDKMKDSRENDDPIFNSDWMLPLIARDMFLLENQLPFFLLWDLFSISTEVPDDHKKNLSNMILYFFNGILPGAVSTQVDEYQVEQIKHLVGFVHDIGLPSPAEMEAYRINIDKNPWKLICCATEIQEEDHWKFIFCAREMQEAGIKFKKVEGGCLFDIKFGSGVMRIPTLSIGDGTESVFRNLIAYEQFSHNRNPKLVIDYIKFMDCLINTPEDAELLRQHGIIDNWLGDDEVIANLINSLGDAVVLGENFYYSEVFNKVNLHCSRRCNKWKAKLRHNYFHSPWAIISFLAALVLLILTFVQTLFSVISYFKSK